MTDLQSLTSPDAFDDLARLLGEWVPKQRWFGGKARDFGGLRLADAVLLTASGEEDVVFEVLVDVDYDDGHSETYQVPLAVASESGEGYVGEVGGVALTDATYVPTAARVLTALAHQTDQRRTARGETIFGRPLTDAGPLDHPRRMAVEQSNTSVVFADTVIFKLFRKLERGENPDVEITRGLTETGFAHIPAQRASLALRHEDGSETALAVVADYLHGSREGWDLATSEVAKVVADPSTPAALVERIGDLGTAVAEMHGALARVLGSRDAGPDDLHDWIDGMRRQAGSVMDTAQRRAPHATAAVLDRRDELLARFDRLADEKATGPLTRTHGDLHLGQVLLDTDGRWQLLDFEGEPARPLAERRALHAPLRDVAGMLRSLDYAAASGSGGELADVPDVAARWRDDAQARLLTSYLDAAARHDVLPHDSVAVRAQLDAFELDKAVYELGYELANRPDWVPIPVGGITRVLDRATA